MIVGLQTHIEGWVPDEDLQFAFDRGARMARIAAMEVSAEAMMGMVAAAERIGFRPYIIIDDPERMRLLPGRDFECRNEDDGDMSGITYRRILNDMAKMAIETGSRLWGPTASNTNGRCIRWGREVKGLGWPAGMFGMSWHSYNPEENTLFAEMEQLAGGLPICISEFGWPSNGITEQEHARKIAELWQFYSKYYAAILYQMYSGAQPDESYGIRRYPRELGWKDAAYVFPGASQELPPPTEDEENDMDVLMTIREDQLVPTGEPNKYTVRYDGPALWVHKVPGLDPEEQPKPDGPVTLSVQPNGKLETRPFGTQGEYEVGERVGDLLRITSQGVSHSFVIV